MKEQSLLQLGSYYNCDKATSHNYLPHYELHFEKRRYQQLNILEIGIGGYDQARTGGNSLKMWRDYFINSNIFGIDIEDKSWLDGHRLKTFRGSQNDENFLRKVCDQIGTIDIVIDDGSHVNSDVIASFKFLFQYLSSSGIYVVEDTQTSYWSRSFGVEWGGSGDRHSEHTTMGFFKSLTDGLNHAEFTEPHYTPTDFDKHIVSIHFYHNLIFIYKGLNDEKSAMLDSLKKKLISLKEQTPVID